MHLRWLLVRHKSSRGHGDPDRLSVAGLRGRRAPDVGAVRRIETAQSVARAMQIIVYGDPCGSCPIRVSIDSQKNFFVHERA